MKFLKIAGKDIGDIFKNRFIRISVIAIIIVPLLYSLLYLDAFWDPYSKLQDMPVAVVNLDNGTSLDGKSVNYGEDLVKNLKDNPVVGWEFTDEEDAKNGVAGEKYYAMFVIPKDFSSKVTAAKEGAPETAQLIFSGNEKKNFLAAQINSRVEVELKAEIVKSISNNYVTVAFDSLYESKDGIVIAAHGSKRLYDGLGTLNEKIPSLETGINSLSNGSSQLLGGQVSLNDAIVKVNDGLGTLDSKVPTLSKVINDLYNGSSLLKDGSDALTKGSNDLYSAFNNKIYPSANVLKNGANELNQKLIAGKDEVNLLSSSVTPIKDGSTLIAQSSTAIKGGYDSVKAGVDNLVTGVNNTSNVLAAIGSDLAKAYASNSSDTNVLAALQKLQALQAANVDLSQNLDNLSKGTRNLQNKLNEFDAGVQKYTTNVSGFADGTGNLTSNLVNVASGVDKISKGLDDLEFGLNEKNKDSFGQGLKSVANNLSSLNGGINTLSTGLNQLNGETPALVNGIEALYSGTSAIKDGSSKLVDGQDKLNGGITELSSNVPELKDGVTKLYDGSNELSTKLSSGAKELSNGLVNSSKVMGEFVSDPIDLKTEAINAVPNYGTGFAPYFIPLSLWIGAIMMFFVITSKVDDDENATKFDKVVGKYISFAFVGVIQAVLVSMVVLMLGLKPASVTMFILVNIFLSLVFISIIQCFIFLFGDVGRLLAIVLLILQLTACGGTFPLEVVPGFFKVLNPFMPFTYAVEALREVISATTINYGTIGHDIFVLSVVFIVFLTISIVLKNAGERLTEAIEGRKAA